MSPLYVGIMTGTSVDGIETALVSIKGAPPRLQWKLKAQTSSNFEKELARTIREVAGGEPRRAEDFAALDAALGEVYAAAVLELLAEANTAPSEVAAIGMHGQTIFHRGPRDATARGNGGLT